ncbi:MAG: threonylcarbamoyl-AMP synthase [Bauldia sp.]|uniref:L-threonylcarbamoyladenylate synthase n=1 Tax=Bauldia sp. TaxID=2575872 RepID=UPI001D4904EF|nr:L-threonylcarbamoyladenylate synthase [Bauldia sp.]MCB1494563.1 threonylcarbamoyl-AMP synthase [Bauldia sp.]
MSNPGDFDAGISAAAAALRRGGLVGMPTETVYGLAADATSGGAVAAIYAAKARPRFNPLIIHASSVEAAERLAVLSPAALALAGAFWPGPLTLVLPKRSPTVIADLATAGLDTVAIRVPAHPVAGALLATLDRPIAAPSANRSGHVSPTTADHVAADLGGGVAVILDAGPTGIGLESTIVGMADDRPRLLRAGGLARSDIEAVIGEPLAAPGTTGGAPVAPGMLRSHYAPAARLRLDAGEVRPGEALIAFGSGLPAGATAAIRIVNLSEKGDLAEAAAGLFATLRDLDAVAEAIAVAPIPDTGLGEAINDRLRRAAAPRD